MQVPGRILWNEQVLLEKLRKIEALIAQPGSAGEGGAAAAARQRLMERLFGLQKTDPTVENRFTLPDMWSKRLLLALLRRYYLDPFRYRGQRRTTVVVKAPRKFIDETVWPEYLEMYRVLQSYLEEVTNRAIFELFGQKPEDEAEAPPSLPGA